MAHDLDIVPITDSSELRLNIHLFEEWLCHREK